MKVKAIFDGARKALNDGRERRWPDVDFLVHYRTYLLESRRTRPDLWIGRLTTDPVDGMDDVSVVREMDFALDPIYASSCQDYIVGRCLIKNTDAAELEKAKAFLQLSGMNE